MTIYWTSKSFPELRDLELSRRNVVWRACWMRPFLHWLTWVAFVSQFILIFIGAAIGSYFDGWHRIWVAIYFNGTLTPSELEHLHLPVWMVIGIWLGGLPSGFVFTQVYSRMIRPYLKSYVKSHDVT